MSPTITVEQLSKTYQVPEREGGFGAAVKSFFKRKYKDVKAVQEVNFKVEQGEVVGFLGPNVTEPDTPLEMVVFMLRSGRMEGQTFASATPTRPSPSGP